MYIVNVDICIIANSFLCTHYPFVPQSHKSYHWLLRGLFSSPKSIYMAQLDTDGVGNKSQFSSPCIINTSNDPQLGSVTQPWVARHTQHLRVPVRCLSSTRFVALLKKFEIVSHNSHFCTLKLACCLKTGCFSCDSFSLPLIFPTYQYM